MRISELPNRSIQGATSSSFTCPKCGVSITSNGWHKAFSGEDRYPWKVTCKCNAIFQVSKARIDHLSNGPFLPPLYGPIVWKPKEHKSFLKLQANNCCLGRLLPLRTMLPPLTRLATAPLPLALLPNLTPLQKCAQPLPSLPPLNLTTRNCLPSSVPTRGDL